VDFVEDIFQGFVQDANHEARKYSIEYLLRYAALNGLMSKGIGSSWEKLFHSHCLL
jgi:2-methylcitrate dehydratase PrpD